MVLRPNLPTDDLRGDPDGHAGGLIGQIRQRRLLRRLDVGQRPFPLPIRLGFGFGDDPILAGFGILSGVGQHRLHGRRGLVQFRLVIRQHRPRVRISLFRGDQIAMDLLLAGLQPFQDRRPNELGQDREHARENCQVTDRRAHVELQQGRRVVVGSVVRPGVLHVVIGRHVIDHVIVGVVVALVMIRRRESDGHQQGGKEREAEHREEGVGDEAKR